MSRSRAARLPHRPAADVLVLAGIGAVVGVLLGAEQVRSALPGSTHGLLTLAAAGVGAGAALLAAIAARLLDDRRPAWIAAALVLYCAVVLPWSTLAAAAPGGPQRTPMLVTYLAALVLLVLSIRPPAVLGSWGAWVIAAGGGLLGVAVLALPDASAVRAVAEGPVQSAWVLTGWTAAAVAFAVAGLRERSAPWLRLGLGLVVLAGAHLHRVATGAGAGAATTLSFAGLRLVGLIVVLVALAQLVVTGLRRLQARDWEQQEELAAAALHLERAREAAADRDHELRNGLAGLAGITHLLSAGRGGTGTGEDDALKQAVLTELGRLLALVDAEHAAAGADRAGARGYPVERVLRERMALHESARRSGDGPLALECEPGLRAVGDPDVLAQVVTNLLANCDRHAPGAPIALTARREDTRVVVEVRDRGPGLPPGAEQTLLERGVRDESAGGRGLGLHISTQRLAEVGGVLTLRTVRAPTGCLAAVTLPTVPEIAENGPLVDEELPSAVSSRSPDNR